MQCAQIFSTSLIHSWNGIKVTIKLQHREVMCMKPLSINSIHAFRNKMKQRATLKWAHEPQRQGNFTEQRHMRVGYNTCYNEEWIGTPPRTLMVVPNVTTHPPRTGGQVGLCTQPASYLLKFSTVHRVRMKPATSEICWVLRPSAASQTVWLTAAAADAAVDTRLLYTDTIHTALSDNWRTEDTVNHSARCTIW